jgi:hypothetical protein
MSTTTLPEIPAELRERIEAEYGHDPRMQNFLNAGALYLVGEMVAESRVGLDAGEVLRQLESGDLEAIKVAAERVVRRDQLDHDYTRWFAELVASQRTPESGGDH